MEEKKGNIEIFVNGKNFRTTTPKKIGDFLRELGLKPERCVVEVNLKAKKYSDFDGEFLNDGDRLYVMSVVAGG